MLILTGKMITIEAWRVSIGTYNGFKITSTNKFNRANNIANANTFAVYALSATIMTAKLISMLLMIGSVETNPGPDRGSNEGKP